MSGHYLCIYFPRSSCSCREGFLTLCRAAVWALKISPLVALDNEALQAFKKKTLSSLSSLHNGLTIDIAGTERVHGGEKILADKLHKYFSEKQMEARLAIAPTIGAAWALSRYGRQNPAIIHAAPAPSNNLRRALAALPTKALRISDETAISLMQLGVETVEDLLKLPAGSLNNRFGPRLLERLQQALGVRNEALYFIRPKERILAKKEFECPLISQESIKITTVKLLKEVFNELQNKKRKAASFIIEFSAFNKTGARFALKKEFTLCHASTNLSHVVSVIMPFIESIKAPGGVCAAGAAALLTSKKIDEQTALLKEPPQRKNCDCAINELIDHLLARLGRDAVVKPVFESSYIPEKSFSYLPLDRPQPKNKTRPIAADRPSCLLAAPEPIAAIALLPDHPPAWINWKGQKLQIIKGLGPERICAEWWHKSLNERSANEARDYFKVQDSLGRWLWIFRNQANLTWFIHGLWI